jgi:transposase
MKVSGLDVHKDTIFCGIYDGKKNIAVQEFTTFTENIREMGIMLQRKKIKRIAMESTSIYWIPVWNILEDMGFDLMLVNPYLIKQMPGRKSDVKDAQWIATLLYKGLLRGSLVPDKQIRELRSYSRRYVKLQGKITSSFQEMERILEMSNIRITSLVSSNNSVSVKKVIQGIIQGKDSVEELACHIHSRILNSKKEKVRKSLEGFISEHHRFNLELVWQQYQLYQEQLSNVEEKMKQICYENYSDQMKLLQTIPGIKEQSAMQIIAETGNNMDAFENSGKITGWAGLRPKNDESAGKFKSTATTKGNKYLRRILVQCAWAASRTKGSYYKNKFEQLCIRKSRKKALIAIARKLLTVVWNVMNQEQPYNPNMLPVLDPEKIRNKMKYHAKELEKLQMLGY